MTNMRKEFLDGKLPEVCTRCWSEEDAGRTSKRMHTLDRLKDILKHEEEGTEKPKQLYFLDLKLGNICNLKCRICGSWSSSKYAGEELLALPKEERKTSFHREMVQRGAWPRKWGRPPSGAPAHTSSQRSSTHADCGPPRRKQSPARGSSH